MLKLIYQRRLVILRTSTMMLDWDIQDVGHLTTDAITINSRWEAIQILQDLCQQSDAWLWRVYKTPGGVRAFCMSHTWDLSVATDAAIAKALMVSLKCDPCYTHFTFSRCEGWRVRVSGKPGRPGDYIAQHLFDVGSGKALPENVTNIQIHDGLVNSYKLAKTKSVPKPILKAKV